MARRCPESRYLGRGKLRGYKWQINTRGYANVVKSSLDTVEGLCFLLSRKDEERLDRNEGVHMVPSAYEKEYLDVTVYPSSPLIVGRRVREVDDFIHGVSFRSPDGTKGDGEEVEALVYMSYRDIGDGPPKSEYVHRLDAGRRDAILLGVPRLYFNENFIWTSPETESVPQKRPLQDQWRETSSGGRYELYDRKSENRGESKPHSSDGDLVLQCAHGKYIVCRNCSVFDKEVRFHIRAEIPIANALYITEVRSFSTLILVSKQFAPTFCLWPKLRPETQSYYQCFGRVELTSWCLFGKTFYSSLVA